MARRNKELLIAFSLISSALCATPKGMEISEVVQGTAIFCDIDGTPHVISTEEAIVNWEKFSLAKDERVRFIQSGPEAWLLNRVVGNQPSEILGQIDANGQIYLVNPHGIYVGEGASIEAASFIASTFEHFNQQEDGVRFSGESKGSIENHGVIRALQGNVYLFARKVVSDGTLCASDRVGVASGHEVLLLPEGDERIFIRPEPLSDTKLEGAAIEQRGRIQAAVAEIKATGNVYAAAIKQEGVIEATGSVEVDGAIYLTAEGGWLDQRGTLKAINADETGGRIHLMGEQIIVNEEAKVDVSAPRGAGTLLCGGDYQGQNEAIQNANVVYVARGAQLRADATESGDGGKLIVWGDQATLFYGEASANAGTKGGDGGFIEVSSPGAYAMDGILEAGSTLGKPGHVLLDPSSIEIKSGTQIGFVMTPPAPPFNFNADSVLINPATITGILVNSDLTLNANSGSATGSLSNILIAEDVIWDASGSPSNFTKFTLIADKVEINNATIQGTGIAAGDYVDIQAGECGFNTGNPKLITVGPGNIRYSSGTVGPGLFILSGVTSGEVTAGGSIHIDATDIELQASSNAVIMQADGDIHLNASNTMTVDGRVAAGCTVQSNGGNCTINVTDSLVLTALSSGATAAITTVGGGNLDITAGAVVVENKAGATTSINPNGTLTLNTPLLEMTGQGGGAARIASMGAGGTNITADQINLTADSGIVEIKSTGGPNIVTCNGPFKFALGSSNSGRITIAGGPGQFTDLMASDGFNILGNNAQNSTVEILSTGDLRLRTAASFVARGDAGTNNTMRVESNGGNLSLNCARDFDVTQAGNNSVSFVSTTGSVFQFVEGNYNVSGNVMLSAANDYTITAVSNANFTGRPTLASTAGSVNFSLSGAFNVNGAPGAPPLQIAADQGLNITTCGNINISGNPKLMTTSGPMTLIAGKDFILNGTPALTSGDDLTIVADNKSSNFAGPNHMRLFGGTITSTGMTRLFTSLPLLNTLNIPINGFAPPLPGALDPISQELFPVFYPSTDFSGPGYTLFYKDFIDPAFFVELTAPISSELFYFYEFFSGKEHFDLPHYIEYDQDAFEKKRSAPSERTSVDNIGDTTFP